MLEIWVSIKFFVCSEIDDILSCLPRSSKGTKFFFNIFMHKLRITCIVVSCRSINAILHTPHKTPFILILYWKFFADFWTGFELECFLPSREIIPYRNICFSDRLSFDKNDFNFDLNSWSSCVKQNFVQQYLFSGIVAFS